VNTVHEIEDRLRALGGALPTLDPPAGLPETIRARAHRRAHRQLIAGTAVLVAAVAAAVVIPVGLLTGGGPSTGPATGAAQAGVATRPLHSYGGMSIDWLPAGSTRQDDGAAVGNGNGFAIGGSIPDLTLRQNLINGTSFYSAFIAGTIDNAVPIVVSSTPPTTTPSPVAASALATPPEIWVTVTWKPTRTWSNVVAYPADGVGPNTASRTTVDGLPATLWVVSPKRMNGGYSNGYGALLTWQTRSGAEVTVESSSIGAQLDPAVLHQVADGVVLGTEPPVASDPYLLGPTPPGPTVAPGSDVDTAVRAIVHAVFTAGTPDAQWAAALQDGQALVAVRHKVEARFPQLGHTAAVKVNDLYQVNPTTVQVEATLSFTDPTIPTLLNHNFPYTYGITGTAVRTSTGWQLTRATYCDPISALGVPAIDCP
jgi:hypothetical protein